jgi:hypothetical protein
VKCGFVVPSNNVMNRLPATAGLAGVVILVLSTVGNREARTDIGQNHSYRICHRVPKPPVGGLPKRL